jgi:glucose-1-phosphate thymidylyltransferase
LDHVLDTFDDLEKEYSLEYVFIIGQMGDQIVEHMRLAHPNKGVTYFVQGQLMGQSHAIYMARDAISGPVLLTYCDTVNRIDFSFLASNHLDGVACVHPVDDPRRHGVAIVGADGMVTRLVEKPETMQYKSALTGLYYFSEGKELIRAIEAQMHRGDSLSYEYYLADAVNILLEGNMRIRAEEALQWVDAGTPSALLDANARFLQQREGTPNSPESDSSRVIIPPVYIHESSRVVNSMIGPNVAIGANCSIDRSTIRDSIIDDNSRLSNVTLSEALIG